MFFFQCHKHATRGEWFLLIHYKIPGNRQFALPIVAWIQITVSSPPITPHIQKLSINISWGEIAVGLPQPVQMPQTGDDYPYTSQTLSKCQRGTTIQILSHHYMISLATTAREPPEPPRPINCTTFVYGICIPPEYVSFRHPANSKGVPTRRVRCHRVVRISDGHRSR